MAKRENIERILKAIADGHGENVALDKADEQYVTFSQATYDSDRPGGPGATEPVTISDLTPAERKEIEDALRAKGLLADEG